MRLIVKVYLSILAAATRLINILSSRTPHGYIQDNEWVSLVCIKLVLYGPRWDEL